MLVEWCIRRVRRVIELLLDRRNFDRACKIGSHMLGLLLISIATMTDYAISGMVRSCWPVIVFAIINDNFKACVYYVALT